MNKENKLENGQQLMYDHWTRGYETSKTVKTLYRRYVVTRPMRIELKQKLTYFHKDFFSVFCKILLQNFMKITKIFGKNTKKSDVLLIKLDSTLTFMSLEK